MFLSIFSSSPLLADGNHMGYRRVNDAAVAQRRGDVCAGEDSLPGLLDSAFHQGISRNLADDAE
jgi:hypothetical protein